MSLQINLEKMHFDKYWKTIWFFVILKFALHLFTYSNYELHRDEMLYFNQGQYLDFGNATVPPLISWFAFIIKAIFGYSVFGVRLLPMTLGSVSVILIGKLVKEIGGGIQALVLACSAFLLSPGFLIFDTLFTVNVFDQFFWLVLLYLVIVLVRHNDPKQWIWIGIFGGIAFLNKYLVVYLLAAVLFALILFPARRLILTRYFAYALVIGFLIIAPNIYWQYSHGWPIFFHIREIEQSQMINMSVVNYFKDLFSLNYVSSFLWAGGVVGVLIFKSEQQYRYLGVLALIVLFLFLVSRGKAYYMLGIVPVYFAFGGYIVEKYISIQYQWVKYAILILVIFTSALAIPFSLPLMSFEQLSKYNKLAGGVVSYPFFRWEDGKVHPISQVFSDMTGWKEMTKLVHIGYEALPEKEKQNATIYAERNYGYAGAINFYGKEYNLPEAITFLDSYVIWAPDSIKKGPLIYINYDLNGLDRFFKTCREVGTVSDIYFRENGLKVFLCEGPDNRIQEVYRETAEREKRKYCRNVF